MHILVAEEDFFALSEFISSFLLIVGWFGVAVGTYFLVASLFAGGLLIAIAILLFSFGCIWISKLIK